MKSPIVGFWLPATYISERYGDAWKISKVTLKISSPLLRLRAFITMMSGSGMSGVSIRSRKPYLCGLSSGRKLGAGMLGERVDNRCAGTGGASSGVFERD